MAKEIQSINELRHEFGEFHHDWCNKYNDPRYLRIYNYLQKLKD